MRCAIINFFNQERQNCFKWKTCLLQLSFDTTVHIFIWQVCLLGSALQLQQSDLLLPAALDAEHDATGRKNPCGSWSQLSQLSSSQLTSGVG